MAPGVILGDCRRGTMLAQEGNDGVAHRRAGRNSGGGEVDTGGSHKVTNMLEPIRFADSQAQRTNRHGWLSDGRERAVARS